MSDVNLAITLLTDAIDDRFDTALIVSGDSDLTTPVLRVRERFPDKRVVITNIGEDKLRKSLLPESVTTPEGVTLQRPPTWR